MMVIAVVGLLIVGLFPLSAVGPAWRLAVTTDVTSVAPGAVKNPAQDHLTDGSDAIHKNGFRSKIRGKAALTTTVTPNKNHAGKNATIVRATRQSVPPSHFRASRPPHHEPLAAHGGHVTSTALPLNINTGNMGPHKTASMSRTRIEVTKASTTTSHFCSITYVPEVSSNLYLGINPYCICKNKAPLQMVGIPGAYPCPKTALYDSEVAVHPTITVTTDMQVVACNAFKTWSVLTGTDSAQDWASYTTCYSTAEVISAAPSLSVMVSAGDGVPVGTMTGQDLVNNISSAIMHNCPTTTGPINSCSPTAAVATKLEMPVNGRQCYGTLEITFGHVNVTDGERLETLALLSGLAASQFVNGTSNASCITDRVSVPAVRYTRTREMITCTMPASIIFLYSSGIWPNQFDDQLWISFQVMAGGEIQNGVSILIDACEGALGVLGFLATIVSLIYPPAGEVISLVQKIVKIGCGAAKKFQQISENLGQISSNISSTLNEVGLKRDEDDGKLLLISDGSWMAGNGEH